LPSISIVLPVFNEERNIKRCLESIRSQDYPQKKVEIILVDDDSTDNTVKIAKKYKVVLCRNGTHNYDIGKSLGIKRSSNEYILFLDADNFLPHNQWLKRIIKPFVIEKNLSGAQPLWFTYNKKYPLADRYAILFGITDPITIYLKKQDRLMLNEKKFKVGDVYSETKDYFLTKFSPKSLPTIGSVGFITKKEYLMKTNYDPDFSHLDCMQDLIKQGYDKFAMVKLDIIHLHSPTIKSFLDKLKRNLRIFLRDQKKRRYKWETSKLRLFYAIFAMSTFIIPFYHSLKGFFEIRDYAWFLHPYLCFRIVFMYSLIMVRWKLGF